MMSSGWGRGIAAVIVVLGVAAANRWWASDERAIRNQMSAIAESLTVAGGDGQLARVTRIATLRNALAPDIRVSAGQAPPPGAGTRMSQDIVGRDAVLGLVSRWTPPPGGSTVEFVDVQVTVEDGGAGAQVYCTATMTSRDGTGQPAVDARELTVGFTNVDGEWLVSSVRPEDTLAR